MSARVWVALLAAALLGGAGQVVAATGLVDLAGDHAGSAVALGKWSLALGAPWLVVAWGLGALAGERRSGAVAGAVALTAGTGFWYVLKVVSAGPGELGYAIPIGLAWGLVAVPGGALFGWAGGVWRSGRDTARAAAAALPAGALVGEALLLAGIWGGRAAQVVLAAELAAGFLLTGTLMPRRARLVVAGVALTAVVALAVLVGEASVRDGLRQVGWNGR
jgi:hypothetical protein